MAVAAKKKAKKKAAANRIATTNGRSKKGTRKTVQVVGHQIAQITLEIEGTKRLVAHAFAQKEKQKMLDKQMNKTPVDKDEPRCPEEEFLNGIHWVSGAPPTPEVDPATKQRIYDQEEVIEALTNGAFGIPIVAFKNAIVSACRLTDFTMQSMKQLIRVESLDDPDYAIIRSPTLPEMRSDMVRIGQGIMTERFRPAWEEWSCTIAVQYNPRIISDKQIIELVNLAGFSVGVLEARPEKAALGWGTFTVKSAAY